MEIERVLQDWEDKCLDFEMKEREAITKAEKAIAAERKVQGENTALTKDLRNLKAIVTDREDEIKNLMHKYEEKLLQKEFEKTEMKAKHMQLVDKAQFEAEYLKRELET